MLNSGTDSQENDTEIECEADMYLHITRIFEEMTGTQVLILR